MSTNPVNGVREFLRSTGIPIDLEMVTLIAQFITKLKSVEHPQLWLKEAIRRALDDRPRPTGPVQGFLDD